MTFMVYIRVCSLCTVVWVLKNTYCHVLPLQCHKKQVTDLSTPCALPIHPSFFPPNLANTDLFTVSPVLPFPKRPIVGIMQYVLFSAWFPSLSNMNSSFLHIFLRLAGAFMYITKHFCMNIPQFIYFVYLLLKGILVASKF